MSASGMAVEDGMVGKLGALISEISVAVGVDVLLLSSVSTSEPRNEGKPSSSIEGSPSTLYTALSNHGISGRTGPSPWPSEHPLLGRSAIAMLGSSAVRSSMT
jgi:hypothetical protein